MVGVSENSSPNPVTQEQVTYARGLNKDSEPRYLMWVTEISDPTRDRQRLLVVGDHFLFILRKGSILRSIKLDEKGHLFKLQQVGLSQDERRNGGVVTIAFESGLALRFLHAGPQFLHHLTSAVLNISYQFPDALLPELSDETRKSLRGFEDPRRRLSPSDGHKLTYLAMCTQEEILPRQSVLGHLDEVLGLLGPGSQPQDNCEKEYELDLNKAGGFTVVYECRDIWAQVTSLRCFRDLSFVRRESPHIRDTAQRLPTPSVTLSPLRLPQVLRREQVPDGEGRALHRGHRRVLAVVHHPLGVQPGPAG
eukprot:466881-Prorocentrum_minimum.AAC.2